MVFSDLKFIYIFFPIFFIVYYLIKPVKYKNISIFFASMVFYVWGTIDKPYYVIFLLLSIVITFYSGIFIEKYKRKKILFLVFSLIYDFGILFFFKYEGFLAKSINSILNMNMSVFDFILPIGISFYTFQAAAYSIDVYRGDVKAEKSLLDFATYLSMFSQVASGPITLYSGINSKLKDRVDNFNNFNEGLKLFVCGLGLKVIIGNNIGGLWREAVKIGFDSLSTPYAWVSAIAYSFQLYFDFYGYSLMAKGLGKMMGFDIPDNFNSPYISKSFTEFWRRWHITLSNWFKNYVYIPLGGSRKGTIRTVFNLLIVWLFTGLWHGADYNYLIWGIIVLILILIEKSGLKQYNDSHVLFGHIYMIVFIPITWAVFAVNDLSQLINLISKMFFIGGKTLVYLNLTEFITEYGIIFISAILLSTPLNKIIYNKIKNNVFGSLVFGGIFALSIYLLCIGHDDPFLYFRF